MSHSQDHGRNTSAGVLDPSPVNVRIKLAGLWATTLFIFAYVDIFSFFRPDVRADIEAGQISSFQIGEGSCWEPPCTSCSRASWSSGPSC